MEETTLTLTLSEEARAFVADQVAARGLQDSSAYFEAILREEQKRQAQLALAEALLKGLQSPLKPLTPETWENIRREGKKRLADRNKR